VALHGPAAYVQVLEGTVVLRNDAGHAPLAAGEWGLLVPGQRPSRLPPAAHPTFALDPPVAATRLAPPAFAPSPPDPMRSPSQKAFAFSSEERLAFARQCLFRWGLPRHLVRWEAPGPDGSVPLSADEREAVGKVLEEDRAHYFEELRNIYREITGEPADDNLSALALHHEIDARASRAEGTAVRQRILQEWAGDVPPSVPGSPQPAIERFWRLQTGELDGLERRLSPVVGPERAHALVAASVDMAATGTEADCPSGQRSVVR
jgi:hypothetical protein